MRGRLAGAAVIAAAITLLALLWSLGSRSTPAPAPLAVAPVETSADAPAASVDVRPAPAAEEEPPSMEYVSTIPRAALRAEFDSFLTFLRSGGARDPRAVRARLAALKKLVHDADPGQAAEELIRFLESGEDAPTGLAFVVGEEGVLSEAPTFRVALLDFLGQTDPGLAVEFGLAFINSAPESPDERALALRNLAWLNHDGRLSAVLGERLAEMLNRPDWQAAPSRGYLESFDIAVELGTPAMLVELVLAMRTSNETKDAAQAAINRASFIGMDRMMLRQPELVTSVFAADPNFLDFAPMHRASLLSRLDPSVPSQAAVFKDYIARHPADSEEMAYFAKIFPNGNFFEGNRLVTSWETVLGAGKGPVGDAAALSFVQGLRADPRYASAGPVLKQIEDRLRSFVTGSGSQPPTPAPAP